MHSFGGKLPWTIVVNLPIPCHGIKLDKDCFSFYPGPRLSNRYKNISQGIEHTNFQGIGLKTKYINDFKDWTIAFLISVDKSMTISRE